MPRDANGHLFKQRRGVEGMTALVTAIISAGILLVVFAIIIGNLLPTGLGSVANGSIGSKMTNVDSSTKGLYNNINLLLVLAIIVLVIAVVLGALHRSGRV